MRIRFFEPGGRRFESVRAYFKIKNLGAMFLGTVLLANLSSTMNFPQAAQTLEFLRSPPGNRLETLRGLGVLTQGLPRGPRGADEPRAIAKPAGCDGNGS